MLKKTFILDTNILLQTPFAMHFFGDNTIVVPEIVLDELDKFKRDNIGLGAKARHVGRLIDTLFSKVSSFSKNFFS